jgi:hypothetical protein
MNAIKNVLVPYNEREVLNVFSQRGVKVSFSAVDFTIIRVCVKYIVGKVGTK